MPGSTIVKGAARRTLVADTALSVVDSIGLGAFEVGKYSRLCGLFSVIGSATIRYRFGIDAGAYQVSSSFTINSGAATFDVLNFGRFADFAVTAANSQVLAALIFAEPLR
jgi:hypothetical protein